MFLNNRKKQDLTEIHRDKPNEREKEKKKEKKTENNLKKTKSKEKKHNIHYNKGTARGPSPPHGRSETAGFRHDKQGS